MTYNRQTNKQQASRQDIVDEVLFQSISRVVQHQEQGIWVGTMTDLSLELSRALNAQQKSLLPASPSALRVAVNRIANRLRYGRNRISVQFRRSHDRLVRFAR